MYYGLEACPVNKSQTKSRYVVNCCFGKMLNVKSKEHIEFCMQMFNCPSMDLTVAKRKVDPGVVEFRRRTASNFYGVEVVE